jgi:hypothetical protein
MILDGEWSGEGDANGAGARVESGWEERYWRELDRREQGQREQGTGDGGSRSREQGWSE